MKFGYFDDVAREYVITTPKTPRPWINYLGSQDFFGIISNTGGGYNFYRDARLRRVTRYRYNNVPFDTGGRLFYIKDGDKTWSPTFFPTKAKLDAYECRHGLGYTTFITKKDGVSADLTCFVPTGQNAEINRMSLKNETDSVKSLKIFKAVEWCLWDTVDDSANFQRNLNIGEVEVDANTIYHKTEYRERRNHYAFSYANRKADSFDSDRDAFLGTFNGWDSPAALTAGTCKNTIAYGGCPIAAHHFDLSLNPGETITLIFILGYCELPDDEKFVGPNVINKLPAKALIEKFSTIEAVDTALGDLAAYWQDLLSKFSIKSNEPRLDRMVNIWNQYQCMVTFNMSRSASYFESGVGRGMGFRDSCQDLLGFVHLIPERARERILDIAAVQLEDGSAWHQYQPLTKRGNDGVGAGFNDDPLWLIAAVAAYLRETGDYGILEEMAEFNNQPGTQKPVMEHLRRSINFTINHLGPHKLPLIGRADWNDCLNLNCFSVTPGESFQTTANKETGIAESVFIAGLFVRSAYEYAEICNRIGLKSEADEILSHAKEVEEATLKHGFDGGWFLRAYDGYGNPVGSKECEEGQIYIEPQGMCAMAGIGHDNGFAKLALSNVKDRLTFEYGTCLLAPCYQTYHTELGEISTYPPGMKENGSVFCHNNPWISIAESLEGNAEEAFLVYSRICPAYLEDISEIHETEPYVYSQTIAGQESPRAGQAKNSWLTGTAAWTFVNVSQYILGIMPGFDGLELRPCLPKHIKGYSAVRKYRDAVYNITVINNGNDVYKISVDGKPLSDHVLPYEPGAAYKVEVIN